MRICIPIHSFEPGGVERVGLRLAERWQEMGHEVTIVLGRDRGATRAQSPRTLAYRTRPEPFSTAAWETPWLILCLWNYLRSEPDDRRSDVLYCAGNTYAIVCAVMKLALGRRCPPVVIKISNDLQRADFPAPVQWGYDLWLRLQGRLFNRFVALADPMIPQLVEKLGVAPDKVEAIPDPALDDDTPTFAAPAAGDEPRPRRFLSVLRLNRQKNVPLLVEAFAKAAREGDTLTIAGEGPDRPRIEAAIARSGCGDRITLAGHVADIRPLFDTADALVLSSDYEGVPAVVLEALAAGKPVAATDCCISMRWLLGEGAYGALAKVGDAGALAAAMNRAAAMTPDRDAMRAFAQAFTLGKAAPRYLSAMERVIAPVSRHDGTATIAQDRAGPC